MTSNVKHKRRIGHILEAVAVTAVLVLIMTSRTDAARLQPEHDYGAARDNTRLGRMLDQMDHLYDTYEKKDDGPKNPPTFNTVSILDTDILDTDDIVAIQRYAFYSNAYGVAACVAGGDEIVRGVLKSIGSNLPVGSSQSATGYTPFWELYRLTQNTAAAEGEFNGEEGYYYDYSYMEATGSVNSIPALEMYKSALRSNKVDIITIGYLNNLYDLLNDPEGRELAQRNLNAVYITGGSLKGLGDNNFNSSGDLLAKSIFVTDTLRQMGIYTVYITGDLGGVINTGPFDSLSRQAFATLSRDTTPSWDIFTVWVYRNRMSNPHVTLVRSSLYIQPSGANQFIDGAENESFRVVKVSADNVIQGLL